ncbi:MAG: hypothetical protein GY823_07300 [Flavobacteriaceae bacterium]|nr:hypothetical protein [Flavobacteriaceae bacterium]
MNLVILLIYSIHSINYHDLDINCLSCDSNDVIKCTEYDSNIFLIESEYYSDCLEYYGNALKCESTNQEKITSCKSNYLYLRIFVLIYQLSDKYSQE